MKKSRSVFPPSERCYQGVNRRAWMTGMCMCVWVCESMCLYTCMYRNRMSKRDLLNPGASTTEVNPQRSRPSSSAPRAQRDTGSGSESLSPDSASPERAPREGRRRLGREFSGESCPCPEHHHHPILGKEWRAPLLP